ncbi:MFS transporter [Companilactobacillus allii]|uniref:MFS transporter n=1 Tax=Companilactobacillus allii TaxID=1847728 RepID=A0A1P8Q3V6_9LACO|nr:MFS transporter [Companilactobacillus allii]APX72527.1 MFS transporter [Companilactobacillus allii]USQ69631.1 MFS transporter [Companilactobacillus allii]
MEEVVPTRVKLSIAAVGLLSFISILVETSMNVTFPTLTKDLNVTLGTVQWLTTGYLLLTTIIMSTTAYILKRFDPLKIFCVAISFCFVGSIVCMTAPSFPILLTGRLLQAVSAGLSIPLMFSVIFDEVPSSKIGIYTGFASIIVSLAPALGPTYGGIVSGVWSWRAIFIGIAPLIILVAILGVLTIRGTAKGVKGIAFDYLSVLGLSIIFSMILFTFDQAGSHGWISSQFGIWIVITLLIIIAFVIYNSHTNKQLIDFSILKNEVLRFRLFGYFGLQFINIGLSFLLPIFAQTVLNMDSSHAGIILLPGSLLGAVVGPIAGSIYDKKGPTIPMMISGVLVTLGSGLFFFLGNDLTFISIIILYSILRIGFNFGFGTSLSDGSMQVKGRKKSDQNSLFSMMQQYAGSLGTNILSVVISAVAVTSKTTSTVINTLSGAKIDFALLTILSLCILIISIIVAIKFPQKKEK